VAALVSKDQEHEAQLRGLSSKLEEKERAIQQLE